MTVKELIEELRSLPEDAKVIDYMFDEITEAWVLENGKQDTVQIA